MGRIESALCGNKLEFGIMLNTIRRISLSKRYRDDEKGNVSLMFAVSAVAVIGCMGAAMDFSTLSNAKHQSQSIADQLALAAAIYVKDNDTPPTDKNEGYTQGDHTAADLGFAYKGWVEGGASNVNVNVNYDDRVKEATVTVTGKTVPTFMQVLGKHDMSFKATSTVSYLQVDEMQPASVVMVLDNSGSMRWDSRKLLAGNVRVPNPTARIDQLKTSVTKFRTDLKARIGDQKKNDGHRVLRTGILPYNSEIIARDNDKDRRMAWGFGGVSNSFINEMSAEGGTNSNPPMKEATVWLEGEDAKHRKEANDHDEAYREPIKFVVFMTDGQNSTGDYDFIADNSTGIYWKLVDGEWVGTRNWWAVYYGYDEGYLKLASDRQTLESCNEMKTKDVKIFTVGFGLEVGKYYDPEFPNDPAEVTQATRSSALSLLSQCASKPENVIIVGEGDSLQGAFDQIQNAVVKELIRIKS